MRRSIPYTLTSIAAIGAMVFAPSPERAVDPSAGQTELTAYVLVPTFDSGLRADNDVIDESAPPSTPWARTEEASSISRLLKLFLLPAAVVASATYFTPRQLRPRGPPAFL